MSLPTPAIIANGMVFVESDGDYGPQFGANGNFLGTEQRMAKTGHAILYALDATTGKVLFSSGDTIHGFSHFSAPTVGGGRVYVGTRDGTFMRLGWVFRSRRSPALLLLALSLAGLQPRISYRSSTAKH